VTSWYLDASALVKRYVQEPGSDWLREGLASGSVPTLFTSRLTIVEVISAFARRIREGSLTQHEFVAARDAFRSDCMDEYQIMPPPWPLWIWHVVYCSVTLCALTMPFTSRVPCTRIVSLPRRVPTSLCSCPLTTG
jgi:hypothetical protein